MLSDVKATSKPKGITAVVNRQGSFLSRCGLGVDSVSLTLLEIKVSEMPSSTNILREVMCYSCDFSFLFGLEGIKTFKGAMERA